MPHRRRKWGSCTHNMPKSLQKSWQYFHVGVMFATLVKYFKVCLTSIKHLILLDCVMLVLWNCIQPWSKYENSTPVEGLVGKPQRADDIVVTPTWLFQSPSLLYRLTGCSLQWVLLSLLGFVKVHVCDFVAYSYKDSQLCIVDTGTHWLGILDKTCC